MKHNFMPPSVSENPDLTITPDDDTDVAIVKFMSSYKAYTSEEVYRALESRVSDPQAIKPTMLALNTQGWFDCSNVAPHLVAYTLRRWRHLEDLMDKKRPTNIRKFKQPDDAIVDPAGRILLSEGIDVGIWKAMSDRKWRTVRDIILILREFGFNALMVDKRIGKLASNGKWFDRRGNSSRTYRLRPEVQCPSIPPVTAVAAPVTALTPVEAPKVALEAPKTLVEAPPVKIEATAVTRTAEPVNPGDHLYTAIWKVMSDNKEYTVNEIAVLLADYGFTQGNISPAMSEFFKNGYVMRRDTRSPSNRLQYAYRLKNMPMPAFKPKYAVDAPTAAPEAKSEVQTAAAPEVPMPALLQPVSTVEDAPLLEFTLRIKGTPITLREFAQLYDELKNAGFLEREASKGGLLVQASYTIKGTVFTAAELTSLVEQMEKLEHEFNNDPLA